MLFDPRERARPCAHRRHVHHRAPHRRRGRARGAPAGPWDARVLAVLGTGVQARSHAARIRRDPRLGRGPRRRTRPREGRGARRRDGAPPPARSRRPSVAPTSSPRRRTAASRRPATGSRRASTSARSATTRPAPSSTRHRLRRDDRGRVPRRARTAARRRARARRARRVRDPAELGELVAGTRPGRTAPEELTLYKSVGVAVQDLAAAALVVAAAREHGVGPEIELEEIHA